MHRFFTGDELGNIKSVTYVPDTVQGEANTTTKVIHAGSSRCSIQGLVVSSPSVEGSQLLAAGYSDGSASAFYLRDSEKLEEVCHWKESRLTKDHEYIGFDISEKYIISCTSNGALRSTLPTAEPDEQTPHLAALPTGLLSWKLSPDVRTFAYGGDEVNLSVWDMERAFSPPDSQGFESIISKKRKRRDLFPGEIWRAKNVPNDQLGLRHPVRVTCLTYMAPDTRQLLVGTAFGNIRRYDIRATSKPLSDWTPGKIDSIKSIHKGNFEHELFIGDHKHNLLVLDTRNGQVVYAYKGISGAVASMASSASVLASAASDRFIRIHSTFPPSKQAGQQQERKGEVLDKVFMKSTPTIVIWDQNVARHTSPNPEDDVWDRMKLAQDVGEDGSRSI